MKHPYWIVASFGAAVACSQQGTGQTGIEGGETSWELSSSGGGECPNAETSSSGPATPDASSTQAELKFDVGSSADPVCPEEKQSDYSYLWVANSAEGTVSKIDTRTSIEVGRYWTHPAMNAEADPSRTSVSLLGDLAVSNRGLPSVTTIAAIPARCIDRNSNGTIESSTGPGDIRPWGEDECVLWSTSFPDSAPGNYGPRPTQWEAGESAGEDCGGVVQPRLWVGYHDGGTTAHFVRLDGASGDVLDNVNVEGWTGGYAPYGGVVNADGDLYANGLRTGTLIHIDAETLVASDLGNPGVDFYGIAIDHHGNPWLAGIGEPGQVAVFDVEEQAWTVIELASTGRLRGVQVSSDHRVWAVSNTPCGVVEVDADTRTLIDEHIPLEGCGTPVGVSVDVDGFVWIPDRLRGKAFKFDPTTRTVVGEVDGLVEPYTYSDMTGAGLALVSSPAG